MTRSWAAASVLAALVLGVAPATPAGAQPGSSGWSIQPSPNPPGVISAQLEAVSCPRPRLCEAVGDYTAGSGYLPLAERWNGSAWNLQSIPAVPGARNNFLSGLSCPAATRCVATGFSVSTADPNGQAMVEIWNGSTWTIQPTPPLGKGGALLDAVSCTAADSCMAVGGFAQPGPLVLYQPLAERWNGSAWTLVPVPNPHADNGSSLTSVSCTAATACMAGGDFDFADIAQSVFAMRWNGTAWAIQHQLNPGSQMQDGDNAVSCTGAAACTSVGFWVGFSGQGPLAEAGNGSTWAREQVAPPRGNRLATLNGVSCLAAAGCVAAGDWSPVAGGGDPTNSLAERWNGSTWAVQPTPNPAGSAFTALNAVDCTSAAQCVAVGSFASSTAGLTLAERYTG
jgi:hypothetical protein